MLIPHRRNSLLRLLWCYIVLQRIQGLQQPRRVTTAVSSQQQRQQPQAVQVRSSSSWNFYFDQLQEFYRQHGHTVVRKKDDPNLCRWTRLQRANFRHQVENRLPGTVPRPKLSVYKIQQLTSIDFVWDVQEYRWNQRLQELRAYVNATNSTQVPSNYPGALGIWVQNNRREYKRWLRGENSTLTVSRIVALNDLQFHRDMTTQKDLWNQRYEQLLSFYQEHGHANVPEDYEPNPALGQWVMNQRTQYRRHADGQLTALSEERIALLEQLDFRWRYREDSWHDMKLRLLDYYEQNGHLRISTRDKENSDLRLWLILQRHYYNRMQRGLASPMTKERVEALESEIPNFPWHGRNTRGPSKSDWARMFDAMREKGISPGTRAKSHWFEGTNPLTTQVKSFWTEEELMALWYSEEEDDP